MDCVRFLLEAKSNPDKCNCDGDTPLICACDEGHSEIVRLLLDADADANIANHVRGTPLICASKKDHREIVHLLLEARANTDLQNNVGCSPLLFACVLNRPWVNIGSSFETFAATFSNK